MARRFALACSLLCLLTLAATCAHERNGREDENEPDAVQTGPGTDERTAEPPVDSSNVGGSAPTGKSGSGGEGGE